MFRAAIGIALLLILGYGAMKHASSPEGMFPSKVTQRVPVMPPKPDPNRTALEKFKISYFQWGAEYSIMTANFTFQNDNVIAVKDIEVHCTHSGASGTAIDSNTRTIYEIFKAKSRRTIKSFNMGFIHPQAKKSGCYVRRLVAIQ